LFSKIIVSSPWYYFLLSFILSFALAFWLYFKNKKNTEASKKTLYSLFAWRFLSTSIILLLLLNIFFKHLQNQTENPTVILAIDNSTSMVSGSDSAFIKTSFLEQLALFKKNVQDKYLVKTVLFGNKASTDENPPTFSEKETDIDDLIREIENDYSNQNIGALIVVSDGIYNKGANPIYHSEKLGYPIYALAIGDTNEIRDIAVQKINHNQIAYLGNNFPVEVLVNAKKYLGKELLVSISQNGIQKAKQIIKVNSNDFLNTCTFTLSSISKGIVKFNATVSVLSDEKNTSNNAQSFVVEIIDNQDKILLLANTPHPDIAAIKEAVLSNSSYELECVMSSDFKKPTKPYSLVIIHGYTPNQVALLSECRNNNVPVWLVNPATTDNLPGVKISTTFGKQNDAEALYNNTFGFFEISDNLKKFIQELPAVKTVFGNYSMSNSANSLLYQKIGSVETENPLLFFNELNGSKNAVFLGDGLWRWKMRDFAEHGNTNLFNELLSKSVQYLAVKNDKSLFRVTAPKIINENEVLELGAEVYNKSYELITEPEVQLLLTNAENKKFNYTFSKTSQSYKLNIGLLPAGEYKYEAKVKNNNELFVKNGLILVKEVVSEKINTVANHQLLFQMANRTNGQLFYPSQIQKLEDTLLKNENITPITYSQTSTIALIDLKWLFLLILILLSIEWFMRKRFLSI
jgi:hypothetical protein